MKSNQSYDWTLYCQNAPFSCLIFQKFILKFNNENNNGSRSNYTDWKKLVPLWSWRHLIFSSLSPNFSTKLKFCIPPKSVQAHHLESIIDFVCSPPARKMKVLGGAGEQSSQNYMNISKFPCSLTGSARGHIYLITPLCLGLFIVWHIVLGSSRPYPHVEGRSRFELLSSYTWDEIFQLYI